MKPASIRIAAVTLMLLGPAAAWAQDVPQPGPAQTAPAYSPQQLDQLLAPVALYPDALLTDILTAATYPLEVVQAERWVSDPNNGALTGDQLTAAMQGQDWDPSVKSLVPFPPVLKMMSDQLDWMQQLGNAFIAQQADVMNEVQHLRQAAEANGKLGSTPRETVTSDAGAIQIDSADPNAVSVPAYDPSVVYGPWPNPDYPPDYFVPPGYDYGPALDSGIYWGPPIVVVGGLWLWGAFDWHHHDIRIDRDRFNRLNSGHPFVSGDLWQHDPVHRRGVAYPNPQMQQRFQPNRFAAAAPGRDFRGFAPQAPLPQVVRPPEHPWNAVRPQPPVPQVQNFAQRQFAPRPSAPPVFGGGGPGAQIRNEAERGRSSVQTIAPQQRFAPAQPRQQAQPRSSDRGQGDHR